MKIFAKIYLYVFMPWAVMLFTDEWLPEVVWKAGVLAGWLFLIAGGMAMAVAVLLDCCDKEDTNDQSQ